VVAHAWLGGIPLHAERTRRLAHSNMPLWLLFHIRVFGLVWFDLRVNLERIQIR